MLVAPAHVAAMNDMLSAVLVSGTGKRAALPGHPAAGKTGTSQDFRDAWFVGYTAQLVGGVWVGNDDGRAMNKVMGGSLPARLWHDVMLIAHEGRAPVPLSGALPRPIASLAARRALSVDRAARDCGAADAARADRRRLHRARDHRGGRPASPPAPPRDRLRLEGPAARPGIRT